jgi:hypothetical protein
VAERRAGKHIADLFAGGKGTALSTLYVGKLLDPIKPILLLPEVLDETKWWRGAHKYVDAENKYIFVYIGNAGGVEINYNSKLVNPREFSSYWDLLQPKWKSKIVAVDPRMRGMDNPVLFFYYHAKLGPEFIKKLYGEMEVSIARDYRQPIDWLAAGKFSLCIPCVSDEMDKAMEQGLPVGQILNLKEGGTLSSSGGTLSLLHIAPIQMPLKFSSTGCCRAKGRCKYRKGARDGRAPARIRCAPIFPRMICPKKFGAKTAPITSTPTMTTTPTANLQTNCSTRSLVKRTSSGHSSNTSRTVFPPTQQ